VDEHRHDMKMIKFYHYHMIDVCARYKYLESVMYVRTNWPLLDK